MLAHGSLLCPVEIASALSLLSAAPAIWAWLRWKVFEN